MKYYLDTEFNEHGGKLISLALVPEAPRVPLYLMNDDKVNATPWVLDNVFLNIMKGPVHPLALPHANYFGLHIVDYLRPDDHPIIIADSPVDIARFCQALSTDINGAWASAHYPRMTFEVHNVDCYPTTLAGAVQHNALWDAMALKHKLDSQ